MYFDPGGPDSMCTAPFGPVVLEGALPDWAGGRDVDLLRNSISKPPWRGQWLDSCQQCMLFEAQEDVQRYEDSWKNAVKRLVRIIGYHSHQIQSWDNDIRQLHDQQERPE